MALADFPVNSNTMSENNPVENRNSAATMEEFKTTTNQGVETAFLAFVGVSSRMMQKIRPSRAMRFKLISNKKVASKKNKYLRLIKK